MQTTAERVDDGREIMEEQQGDYTGFDWYAISTVTKREDRVKKDIMKRAESMGMGGFIIDVDFPEEEVMEIVGGVRKAKRVKTYPGYVFVRMKMDDATWICVRHTPGVKHFIGEGARPTAISENDIKRIFNCTNKFGQLDELARRRRVNIEFAIGDTLRIMHGPFENFEGQVTEVAEDTGKIKLNVSIFGRETPVILQYTQLEKI